MTPALFRMPEGLFIGKFIGRPSLTGGKKRFRAGASPYSPVRHGRRRLTSRFFFPAAGNGNGTSLNNAGTNGNYWSRSLVSGGTNGYNLNFNSSAVNPANNNNRFNGFSVRAVQHLPKSGKGSIVWLTD